MGRIQTRRARVVFQEEAVTQQCLKGHVAVIRERTMENSSVSGPGQGWEALEAEKMCWKQKSQREV